MFEYKSFTILSCYLGGDIINERIWKQFENVVSKYSNKNAVIGFDNTINYSELKRKSEHVASKLLKLGVGRNVVVGVRMSRSTDLIVAYMAIIKVGGAIFTNRQFITRVADRIYAESEQLFYRIN